MEYFCRKTTRLKKYDYNTPGYYFITLCTHNKEKLLCTIVGTGLPDGPHVEFTDYGKIVEMRLEEMSRFYQDIHLEKYVIMPNHIHLLLHINGTSPSKAGSNACNNRVSQFIGTFKRFCNRKIGKNIWQNRSHDHVIRGEADYQKIWMYIDTNPLRWEMDCFYQ